MKTLRTIFALLLAQTESASGTSCGDVRREAFPNATACEMERECSEGYICRVSETCAEYNCIELPDCVEKTVVIDLEGKATTICVPEPPTNPQSPFIYECSVSDGSVRATISVPEIIKVFYQGHVKNESSPLKFTFST